MYISEDLAHRFTTEYTDLHDKPARLTTDEVNYFNATVAKVLSATGIDIPVFTHDHEVLPGTCADALGIHWRNIENPADEYITIDCYFIHEAHAVRFDGWFDMTGETLESVICHELAHIKYERHTKYHTQLTAKYIDMVNAAA